jgi:uncharacterized membrane protein YtjA (UPF0391 family)
MAALPRNMRRQSGVSTAEVCSGLLNLWKESEMLKWAVIFAIVALIAGGLGFTGLAGAAAGIAKLLFVLFLIGFVVFLVLGFWIGRKVAGD